MPSKNLVKKIQENIFRHRLFPRGAKIVVGVSGGPDSVCLLDIFYKLKKKYDLEIIVAHVNYGLRGKASKKDEALVKKMAEKYSLPLEEIRITNYKLQITEDYLRNLRYDFFEKIREKYSADVIAVGHNLNDQAETVLLRILRGTGLRGLGAIKFSARSGPTPSHATGQAAQPKKNACLPARQADGPLVIRPLLNIPRKDILAHLRKNKLPFRTDKTNLGTDFTRNKIRNKLLPYLEKNFNPNIQEILYKLSQSAADDYDFINKYSAEWLKSNRSLCVSKLTRLHPAIQREVIRLAIEKHIPNLREIEAGHMNEISKVMKSGKNKKQILKFKGLKIERKGDRLVISKKI